MHTHTHMRTQWVAQRPSRLRSKTFSNQQHEFLLSLVDEFHVVNKLSKSYWSIGSQSKRVPRLNEKFNEVRVVPRADVSQSGMGRTDVGRQRCTQKWRERRPVVWQWSRGGFSLTGRGAASENVRQHSRAVNVLDQCGQHACEFIGTDGASQRAGPSNVGERWVCILPSGHAQSAHCKQSCTVRAAWMTAAFEVPRNGKQLCWRHCAAAGGRRHDVVRTVKRGGTGFTQR